MERRDFLKRTGLTLGFLVAPGGLLRVVDAHACGEEGDVDLNAWVHISNSENTITVKCPTAEMGQGNYTAIPLLVAEELDADWRTMRVEQAASEKAFLNPALMNTQGAGGARSAQGYWRIARLMGAQARAILIANAARYSSDAAGAVEVTADLRPEGSIELTIGNDGPPIAPEVRAQLFEPFFTTYRHGTGLGLFLARELAIANGADLFLDDDAVAARRYGCAFTLRIAAGAESGVTLDAEVS